MLFKTNSTPELGERKLRVKAGDKISVCVNNGTTATVYVSENGVAVVTVKQGNLC